MLKSTSDELIDLIDKMLKKDPDQRIDNLEIFDHPWIKKYRYNRFGDDYGSEEEDESKSKIDGGEPTAGADKNSTANNSDLFGEQNNQETNFDSDPV